MRNQRREAQLSAQKALALSVYLREQKTNQQREIVRLREHHEMAARQALRHAPQAARDDGR